MSRHDLRQLQTPRFRPVEKESERLGESIITVPSGLGAQYQYQYQPPPGRNIDITVNPGSVNTSTDGSSIRTDILNFFGNLGTVTAGANLGSGVPVFEPLLSTPAVLRFRTLIAGSNITLQRDAPAVGDITINATGPGTGTVTGGANEGTGIPVFDPTTSTTATLEFRTLVPGPGISLAQDSPAHGDITITATSTGTVTGGANEGGGVVVFDPVNSTASTLEFKTLIAGTGVTLTPAATTVTIAAPALGTVTGGANEGGGADVFDPVNSTATTLEFKTLVAGTGVTLTPAATTVTIAAPGALSGTVTGGANEGGGVVIFDSVNSTASTLEFKTLVAGSGISLTPAATNVTIAATGGGITPSAAEFFGLTGPVNDYAATIAIDAPVPFPQNGSATGTSVTRQGILLDTFNLVDIGIYLISWQGSFTEPGQLTLCMDPTGVFASVAATRVANTTVGRATGTSQIAGNTLLTTTVINTQIRIYNDASPAALTVTVTPGGTEFQGVSLTIVRIA